MNDFHKTIRGGQFYDHHVPQIAKSLGAIAVEMKQANILKERELNLKERELDFLEKNA